eukprot:306833-Chlamydomonas_euryale.AAC.5
MDRANCPGRGCDATRMWPKRKRVMTVMLRQQRATKGWGLLAGEDRPTRLGWLDTGNQAVTWSKTCRPG